MWVLTRKTLCCRGGEWRGLGDLEHATGRRVEQREGGRKERPQEKKAGGGWKLRLSLLPEADQDPEVCEVRIWHLFHKEPT